MGANARRHGRHVLTDECFVQTAEKGKAVASADAFYMAEVSEPVTDWQDYSNYYDEYDDDEEVSFLLGSTVINFFTCLCAMQSTSYEGCASSGFVL